MTANLRKRIYERLLHSRIPAVLVVVVVGNVCTLWGNEARKSSVLRERCGAARESGRIRSFPFVLT